MTRRRREARTPSLYGSGPRAACKRAVCPRGRCAAARLPFRSARRSFIVRAMTAPRLECRGLVKELASGSHRLTVLSGIDLAVAPGEFVAILGPSGSGKTTLLGLLAGLDQPTKGVVRLDGQDLGPLSEDARARLRAAKVGFVFQTFQLLPTLTALENVLVPIELQAATGNDGEGTARGRQLLARVGLGDRAHHYPAQLSGGEQQRVAIARAVVHEPKLVLADEPTGNLDAETAHHVLEVLLRTCRERNATLIVATHSAEIAARAERVIAIRDGRIAGVEV